jgi:hypothetical protein
MAPRKPPIGVRATPTIHTSVSKGEKVTECLAIQDWVPFRHNRIYISTLTFLGKLIMNYNLPIKASRMQQHNNAFSNDLVTHKKAAPSIRPHCQKH